METRVRRDSGRDALAQGRHNAESKPTHILVRRRTGCRCWSGRPRCSRATSWLRTRRANGQYRGLVGRLELGMHGAKETLRQQTISGHSQKDTRLTLIITNNTEVIPAIAPTVTMNCAAPKPTCSKAAATGAFKSIWSYRTMRSARPKRQCRARYRSSVNQ